MQILTVTLNPAIDKSTSVDALVPEQKLKCSVPKFEPGGGGVNVARAIRHLGGDATALYLSGGYSGQFFDHLLEKEGIPTIPVQIQGATRENMIVVDRSNNQQYRFGMEGPLVQQEEWERCLKIISRQHEARYIVGSGSLSPGIPDDFFARLAVISRELGARFILDTSGKALQLGANEGVYLLKPNLAELSALVGVTELHGQEVEDAALEIIRRGNCEVVVVSLGPGGALLVSPSDIAHFPAPTVKKRSTVGAGDSMVAGMVLALSQGKDLRQVVRYGVACGSAATMSEGTGLCKKEDVERLFRSDEI